MKNQHSHSKRFSLRVSRTQVLHLTNHLVMRMKSRGVTPKDLKTIYRFGFMEDGKSKSIVYFIPETPFIQLLKPELAHLQGTRMVVSQDGYILTVMWKQSD